ncbi:MAG: 3-isopropylmalate dehydrogenase [Bacteroidota bacterium]|jgi:3-isopropylmalate dehydrogenase
MIVNLHIAVLAGDGIGPEVTHQAIRVLDTIAKKYGHVFNFEFGEIGAASIEKFGEPLTRETLDHCLKSDAILFGAVGEPQYDMNPDAAVRPEQGLFKLRKSLGLFANIRPVKAYSTLQYLSPLKSTYLEGVDIMLLRELTGGIYFGKKEWSADKQEASDLCIYNRNEIARVAQIAFKYALQRRKKLTVVDKANVLETSKLWRKTVSQMAADFPDVQLEFMYIDNAALRLITHPKDFDVILTENLFGDILSDESSALAGSLGLLPSASYGEGPPLFEPIHGSYNEAKGKDLANPIGTILSAAMMLDHFGLSEESNQVRDAVGWTIENGFVTKDLDPVNFYFTSTIGEMVCDYIMNKTNVAIHKENIQIRKSTII